MGSSELQIQTDNGYIGMPSNICCVIVEYCPGGALKSFLIKNRRRKLAFKVVVQLALDLARGLDCTLHLYLLSCSDFRNYKSFWFCNELFEILPNRIEVLIIRLTC